jgi:hypothetical protein
MSIQKIANLQGQDFNGRFGILSTGRDNKDQIVAQTSNGLCLQNKCEFGLSKVTTITSAQLLALFTTPVEIVPAPSAGFANVLRYVAIAHGAGTAYAGIAAGEDLVVKYAGGAQVSSVIETTGFLDQATAQIRYANAPATTGSTAGDITPIDNTALQLALLVGNITTGNFNLQVLAVYDVIPTDFAA